MNAEYTHEYPVTLTVNDIAHAVMVTSGVDLEVFAVGLAFSEGIIESLADLRDLHISQQQTPLFAQGVELSNFHINLVISPRRFQSYKETQRFRQGLTGCGLCGTESLAQAFPSLAKLPARPPVTQLDWTHLHDYVRAQQTMGSGVHAGLLIGPTGDLVCGFEDIGRHNVLDKLIGYSLQSSLTLTDYTVVMSSRCGSELIQKAVRAGVSNLVHLSTPSQLAISLANHYQLNLIHCTRQGEARFLAGNKFEPELESESESELGPNMNAELSK